MVFSPAVADGHDGQQPQHRLPGRLPGLHRRQAVRPRGPGRRRAPLPRALQLRRLPRQRARHPAAAGQGRRGAGPGRLRSPESHSGRALRQILETYPRNELFQIDADELYEIATGILEPAGPAPGAPLRPARRLRPIRLLPRVPAPGSLLDRPGRPDRRPRSRRRTAVRAPSTRSSSDGRAGPPPRAGRARAGGPPPADRRRREAPERHRRPTGRTSSAPRSSASWARTPAWPRWPASRGAFPADYRTPTRRRSPPPTWLTCWRSSRAPTSSPRSTARSGAAPDEVRFTLMRPGAPLVLSEVLPLLEHLGVTVVDERTARDPRRGRAASGATTSGCGSRTPAGSTIRAIRDEFCATFAALFRGEVESDGLNQLVLAGGLCGPPGRRAAGLRQVPAPDRPVVQPALRRGHAGPPRADRGRAGAAVRAPLRPGHRSPTRPR